MLKIIQDISIDSKEFGKKSFSEFFPNSDVISFIYNQSKVDLNNFYETCALISSKSSNNQEVVENMEYYVFNNYMVYFTKIIEAENGDKNGNASAESAHKNASSQFSSSMRSAKSSMKPNMGNFKKSKL